MEHANGDFMNTMPSLRNGKNNQERKTPSAKLDLQTRFIKNYTPHYQVLIKANLGSKFPSPDHPVYNVQ